MAVTITQADAYFQNRLHAEPWESADPITKEKALATAEQDINMLPLAKGLHASPMVILRAAICEQALWLLGQTKSDRERMRAIEQGVTSRKVGDAGETYSERLNEHHISPKSRALLRFYINKTTGGIR
ncbi:MAG: hypothetical protein ACOY9Y_09745 [Bacillota bacterium]